MREPMPRRLLIVDDDPTIRTSLAEALADNGTTEVRVAEGSHRALAMLDVAAPDVVLSDVRMPEMDGIAFLKVLRERAPSIASSGRSSTTHSRRSRLAWSSGGATSAEISSSWRRTTSPRDCSAAIPAG